MGEGKDLVMRRSRWINGTCLVLAGAGLAIWIAWTPVTKIISHHQMPWRGIVIVVAGCCAFAGLGLLVTGRRPAKERPISASREGNPNGDGETGYPPPVQEAAQRVKALLQMAIGLYALGWLAWSFFLSHRIHNCAPLLSGTHGTRGQFCYLIPPSAVAFKVVADALAAATVIQLAFTLFTPGPDEALDPVLLAVATALLLQLGQVEKFGWQDGLATVLFATALGVLFVVRVFLAPEKDPGLWWWWSRRRRRTSAAMRPR